MELPESENHNPVRNTHAILIENTPRGSDSDSGGQDEDSNNASQEKWTKKPLAFHLSFTALIIMAFICAPNATMLGFAIPIRCFSSLRFGFFLYLRHMLNSG